MARFGLVSLVAGVILMVLGLVSFASFIISRHFVLESVQERALQEMHTRLNSTQGTAQRFLQLKHLEGVKKVVSAYGSDLDLDVALITDYRGHILASTRYRDEGLHWAAAGYGLDARRIERVTRTRTSDVFVDRDSGSIVGYISICDPNVATGALRGQQCGFLLHRQSLGFHIDQALASLYRQALYTAGGFVVCAVFMFLIFHRAITRRVVQILEALQRFGNGDRFARSRLTGSDELATIGRSLDRILDELAEDEAELRNSERFKQAMLDSANSALISVNSEGTIVFFSAGAERMLGYGAAQLLGKARIDQLHDPAELRRRAAAGSPDQSLAPPSALEVCMGRAVDGTAYEDEWTYVRQDGSKLTVDLSVTALFRADGSVSGFMAIARDVTAEKLLAQRLKLAEQVFESAGEGIMVTDETLHVVDVNPAYLRVTGYERHEVVGGKPALGNSGRHERNFFRDMWREIRSTGRWSGELWDRRKNGEVFPQWLTVSAITDDQGRVSNYVGVFKDVSRQKAAEEELERMAYYDPLTGLPNRVLFKDRLQHEIDVAERKGLRVALLFIDLDHFKYVNDTLGHDAGDQLLAEAARRIRQSIRQSDTISRLGGDEFTLVLSDIEDPAEVSVVAERVIASMRKAFSIAGREVFVGASVGIGLYPDDGRSVSALTKNADTAMYLAKQAGRGTYRFFAREMNTRNQRRMVLEASLRRALDADELALHYQPKLDLASRQVLGFEALLRWEHPDFGLIPPADFIPLAEETGLILPIGKWALREACGQLRRWRARGFPDLQMSVNLSALQFQEPGLVSSVAELLDRCGLEPSSLELELTETMVMQDAERALAVMQDLRRLGVALSIDDFGMGYSSLSYLKRFPIQALKIDRSFVRDVVEDPEDAGIVRAIISLAATLQLGVVAEGVETDEQQALLIREGCQLAQGFLYSRPLPAREAGEFLASWKGAPTLRAVPNVRPPAS